jgi:hypothetical protein
LVPTLVILAQRGVLGIDLLAAVNPEQCEGEEHGEPKAQQRISEKMRHYCGPVEGTFANFQNAYGSMQ